MYLPQAAQNTVKRKKAQNLDFVKFFSLDEACKTMLYVFTANRTKRSLAEKAQNLDFVKFFFVKRGVCGDAVCIYRESHKTKFSRKKHKILIFQYFFRQTRRVRRSCMYILRAAQNEVWREKDEKSPVKHCAETLIRE